MCSVGFLVFINEKKIYVSSRVQKYYTQILIKEDFKRRGKGT